MIQPLADAPLVTRPLLILGETPAPGLIGRRALALLPHAILGPEAPGRHHANAADRLLLWSRVPVDVYLSTCDRENLLGSPLEVRRGRWHHAWRAGVVLRAQPRQRLGVVALGNLVRRALLDAGCELVLTSPSGRFDSLLWEGRLPVQCLPHPSGRNRHTNPVEMRSEIGRRFSQLVSEARLRI